MISAESNSKSRKVKILGRPANASLSEDWNWQRGAISVDSDGVGLRFPATRHNARIFALVERGEPFPVRTSCYDALSCAISG
jgi:hypothetical protein